MKPFAQSSYLSQVRRLRELANVALLQYSVQPKRVEFIQHGENTTFKVIAKNGKNFLLRIHRKDYHTQPALKEELNWLTRLSKNKSFTIPTPLRSKKGELIVTAHTKSVGERNCCLFHWTEGRFVEKSISEKHLVALGETMAKLQEAAPRTKHRLYWDSAGLVGRRPKFGPVDKLDGISAKDQRTINIARERIYKKLRNFEKKFPQRMGLIHADLHFGNLIYQRNGLAMIDFDDCGFGFHAADLAVSVISLKYAFPNNKKRVEKLKRALIAGYSKYRKWDRHDEEILPYMELARRLTMLGWLNSRSDNPRLKQRIPAAVERFLTHLKLLNK